MTDPERAAQKRRRDLARAGRPHVWFFDRDVPEATRVRLGDAVRAALAGLPDADGLPQITDVTLNLDSP